MMNIFIVVYFRIDTVMIAILRNDLELGWYSAAYRLLEGMILIPNMIMAPIYPVFSRLFISSIDSLMLLYKYVLKIMTIISLPITIVAMFLSEEIIRTFYGTAFANSTYALLILIWAIPFIFLTFVFGALLPAINKQNINTISTGICMIFNILLNLILIPSYGYLGASIVTVLTEVILSGSLFFYISRKVTKCNLKLFLRIAILNSVTVAFALVLYSINNNYVVNILLYLTAYVMLFVALGIVSRDEIKISFSLLPKKKQLFPWLVKS